MVKRDVRAEIMASPEFRFTVVSARLLLLGFACIALLAFLGGLVGERLPLGVMQVVALTIFVPTFLVFPVLFVSAVLLKLKFGLRTYDPHRVQRLIMRTIFRGTPRT